MRRLRRKKAQALFFPLRRARTRRDRHGKWVVVPGTIAWVQPKVGSIVYLEGQLFRPYVVTRRTSPRNGGWRVRPYDRDLGPSFWIPATALLVDPPAWLEAPSA